MAQPLRIRLAGNEKEILKDLEMYGDGHTMHKWGIKDYVHWRKWVYEQTQNEKFGLNPKIGIPGGKTIGEVIVDALIAYVLRTENERKNLRERIDYLEYQLSRREVENKDKVIDILEAMGETNCLIPQCAAKS